MTQSRLDRLLSPWVFVLTGIVFNILSAVITHYFIGLNNDRINILDRDTQNQQVLIDSLWNSRIEVERKKEFFILLLTDSPDLPVLIRKNYHAFLKNLVAVHGLSEFEARLQSLSNNDLELLLTLSAAAKAAINESINATYFETLALEEAKIPLERSNSRLFSIAIFLQVTGLILVLARDLRRR